MLIRIFVLAASIIWLAPFIYTRHGAGQLSALDRRARWGLLLQVAGLLLMASSLFLTTVYDLRRVVLSALLFVLAFLLAHFATRSLGSQLRIDAAIGDGHKLIRTGPYRILRHPIYASMLFFVWAIGAVAAPISWLILATIVFLIGTEIRVRIEDQLLHDHFGEDFLDYRNTTRAYIPLVR
jgi:protein-S-isoprenylcysteine O-methyltransferase Ste14